MFKKSKYLEIRLKKRKAKTLVFSINAKKSGNELGIVKWCNHWRMYCFHVKIDWVGLPFHESELILSSDCMEYIAGFLEQLNQAHKKSRPVDWTSALNYR